MMYKEAVARYLGRSHNTNTYPKAILFDMDGVLFDSMPYHADSWHTVMERYGLHLSREESRRSVSARGTHRGGYD